MFQVENSLSTYEPHACVVVYSVTDRSSVKVAEDILHYLWRQNFTQDKSVIVVGNKADLARARVVPTTGELIKRLTSHFCD
jgi:Rad and Gem related GTP binding protein 1